MGALLFVQVDPALVAALTPAVATIEGVEPEAVAGPDLLLNQLARASRDVDAVVLGPQVDQPVRLAQRVQRVDRDVALLLLSEPGQVHHLRHALQFAPLLGDDVTCHPTLPLARLPEAVAEAIGRTRQRRRYRAALAAASTHLATFRPPFPATQFVDRLLDHAPIGVVVVDAGGLVLAWNRQAGVILGREERQVLGTRLVTLFPDEEQPRLESALAETTAADGLPAPIVLARTAPVGTPQFVEVRTAPLAGQGTGLAILVLLQDVTDRIMAAREQAQAEASLRFLADASTALAASLDYAATLQQVAQMAVPTLADWCTVWCIVGEGEAPATLRHVASAHRDPEQEPLLRAVLRYLPDPANLSAGVSRVLRTGAADLMTDIAEAEWQAVAQDAEHLRLLRLLRPTSHLMLPLVAHGRTLGVLSLVMAGSGRRYESTALPLAEEVARRAALAIDNAQLYRQVQEALRLREEFLSIASHELKTPLTTIKGYIQILDRQLRHPSAEPARLLQVTEPLRRQIDRLEALVTDLLDISRMQQGRLELRREPVELGELARQVLARLEGFPYRQPGHSLVVEAPAPVIGWWDGGRLDQVLTNLVANALKYSPGGGEVRVTVGQAGDEALVAVSDQGQGMTPEEQARLFQPFSRGQAINHAIPGVGLGLYIAAQVVKQHGGRITVQSVAGGGSTFTVYLPLTRAEPSAPPAS